MYRFVFKTVFTRIDPEQAHHLVISGLRLGTRLGAGRVLERLCRPQESLQVRALGLVWPSPFGLAAGFDKGATAVLPLSNLGFGHIEIGTVTAAGQPGNPSPRLFRLVRDRALINRMGFNNDGAAAVRPRLEEIRSQIAELKRAGRHAPVIGVNIGKTKVTPLEEATEDYLISTRTLAPVADYLVVNVSSPNTPGLRQLQDITSLRPLLAAVGAAADEAAQRHVPLLVKIAPDLADADVDAVAELVNDLGLDGVIATNTTISREGLHSDPAQVQAAGAGGLSGPVLAERSKQVLVRLRAALPRTTAIISVGGVSTGAEVAERLALGADLVQGYTAFVYEGPFWVRRINRDLRTLLRSG
ncbi:quinone-dependent dihydroorotate dehydrogenase [Nesterenkonia sp. E16_7]|uniref:quinone-dependent dihydroorotate dehydrogenase n=1 Tax=unclassified Nesterenkonia TaxID=2629769 RepID=UPI001A92E752|nr:MULTISPECIES: quinone-dependent dihydroorotate dehydrogenase [unclassified Nesterenkonia]MBO0595147.1 quinone-dependent dihydroorotate dehydrogenase [Nesterenkonia sp. E16_10]MBO0599689.1 quinone-dependent dihydroorotate dehydrogenase [Nesterenkonia sp. E16_7]